MVKTNLGGKKCVNYKTKTKPKTKPSKKNPKPPKHHKIKSYKQIRNKLNYLSVIWRGMLLVHLGSALMSSSKVSQRSTQFTFSK